MNANVDHRSGTTAETSLNVPLAALLRSYGLDAEAEQRNVLDPLGRRHQVDVLIELEGECVAIEAEFAPAATVQQDALSRLPESAQLLWRGEPITRAFTLVYPQDWESQPQSVTAHVLGTCTTLEFQQVTRLNGSVVWAGSQCGSVRDLADLLLSFWNQSRKNSIDGIVNDATAAIDRAAAILANDPYMKRPHGDSDPAATCALVWLNALLFQELLAANLSPDGMPEGHQHRSVPAPQQNASTLATLDDWESILAINWVPIFELARQSLSQVSSQRARLALDVLRACASNMAENRAIRRHDIAGRIFHRLLNSRKFLATNYTTIPAAAMLAGLAFGSLNSPLADKSFDDEHELAANLRIVDPACGSGTLLMAALQELSKHCRSARVESGPPNLKPILEQSLWGYDVVPGAQHLTNSTLSMAETSQVLSGIHIYVMPHDVRRCEQKVTARLGSLDFLKRAPNHHNTEKVDLFPDSQAASRTMMSGENELAVRLPEVVDLFISNPPYTRAGGPGDADNTEWNPLFGSVLSQGDSEKMNTALKKTLAQTVGSLYAGLGSAFMALIDQEIQPGKMLAVVLPLTSVTGSRWQPVRETLLEGYVIEWVVVSHDPKHRGKTKNLPGRLWVSFSESTRIAETLIVARKGTASKSHLVKFVNLRHNPDDPADAIALTRAFLNHKAGQPVSGDTNMLCADIDYQHCGDKYGEIISVPQSALTDTPWPYVVFTQCELTEAVERLRSQSKIMDQTVPITTVGAIANLGPYHMQIKGTKHGLFDCREATPTGLQIPALWHHTHNKLKTLETTANAVLKRRRDRKDAQDAMLKRAGRLQLASTLRHAPQRLAATITDQPMLGISSWTTLNLKDHQQGAEEALCLWLNSTLGLLLRITHANRPYLGRSGITHELAATMPVLDVTKLSDQQLNAARLLFDELKGADLEGFGQINTDKVRCQLNRRFVKEVLEGDPSVVAYVDTLTDTLASEPLLTSRH